MIMIQKIRCLSEVVYCHQATEKGIRGTKVSYIPFLYLETVIRPAKDGS